MFQDITTLLLDHKAFKDTVDIFVDRYRDMGISVVAGYHSSSLISISRYFLLFFFFWCGSITGLVKEFQGIAPQRNVNW